MTQQLPAVGDSKVSRTWIVAFVAAVVGVAAGWFGPIQILLPAQAADLEAASSLDKEAILALATAVGAAASMIANPLWGALSDRLRTRWGRRRPIVVAGTVVGVIGLLWLAAADSVPEMVTAWVIVQIGLNGPFAALAALIADAVPERQRGLVGALFGVAQTVGVVLGTAIAVAAGEGSVGYVAVAVAVPLLSIAILVAHKEAAVASDNDGAQARRPPLAVYLKGLKPTRLFAWAWTVRLLLNLVNALVLLYLYYFFQDRIGVDKPGDAVLITTVVCVIVAAAVAGAAGPMSDRLGRRLPFAAAAAAVLAAGAGAMALAPSFALAVVGGAVVGLGWGLYIAVDLAILTSALGDSDTKATMLGLGNIASSLPQVLAPAIAAPVVAGPGGYVTLYVGAAALALLAGACLPALRPMR